MSEVTERGLNCRHGCICALIAIIVLSIMLAAVSILISHPPKLIEDKYSGQNHVLFIVIDDLRPALRCYGDPVAVTPNIDNLASKSIIFKNAFAQQALGTPSRTSFFTARRPDSLHLYDDGESWKEAIRNFITLPEHFKNNGYETISVGKVFPHGDIIDGSENHNFSSWSFNPYWPFSQEYETKPVCPGYKQSQRNLICPVYPQNMPGGTLPDIESTDYAIEFLKNKSHHANTSVPFFLAVGYLKPHIPFRIPHAYFDLYPDMDLAPNQNRTHLPKVAWNPWMDIRELDDVKSLNLSTLDEKLPEHFQKLVRQGYYAAVSYIDDQIGRLLEALENTGFAEHTIVVLLGDNGWSLGEHQEWSKYSNFEVSLKVPLIVQVPKLTTRKNRKPFQRTSVLDLKSKNETFSLYNIKLDKNPAYVSEDLIELVDIFSTVSELANIAIPNFCEVNNTKLCSEGNSFYPVIEHMVYDPEPWIPFSWKTAAFSQYPRPSLTPSSNSDKPLLKNITIMGYSIRTEKYRYTEWVKFDNVSMKPDWPLIISRELYSHEDDPLETENLCDDENYANIIISLSRRIKKGWRKEMPPGNDNF